MRQCRGGDVRPVARRVRLASVPVTSGRVTPPRRVGHGHTGHARTVHTVNERVNARVNDRVNERSQPRSRVNELVNERSSHRETVVNEHEGNLP